MKSVLDFCINEGIDIKREDAILVLETIKKLIEES
jgi:hypothetical protein